MLKGERNESFCNIFASFRSLWSWNRRFTYIAPLLSSLAGFSIEKIGILLAIMIWGTSAWLTTPANQFYLISLKPQSSEIVLSFNTALMNIGMTLGAGLGGVVIEYTSVLNLGWIAGLTVLLALLTASISFGLDKRRKENFVNS
ncbi:hypothetical protein [Sutcliffiella horikoshii]|uniref:hypothetical protein n=1 Tax=Sutcliffiella horikoshii TaxID=79883 RepID=UPI003CEEBC2E